jgi:hypothetical protein
MNDSFVTTIPFIGTLASITQWILLLNVVLIGLVILFAYRAAALKARVEDLERQLHDRDQSGL